MQILDHFCKQGKEVESKTLMLFKDYKTNQGSVTEADFNQDKVKGRLDCQGCHPLALHGSFEDTDIRLPQRRG